MAASAGNGAVVQLLLGKSSNVNISDLSGYTPLSLAAWRGHDAVVRLLLDAGASPNPEGTGLKQLPTGATDKTHAEIYEDALRRERSPDHFNIHGRTPLHMASAGGHSSVARLLLDAGAKPNTQDQYGRTPIFNAVCGGHLAMALLLLSLPDVDRHHADIWGVTPALEAEKRGLHELSSLLCEDSKGAEQHTENPPKYSDTSPFCDLCLVFFSGQARWLCV
jgi:ankyrin repeat protein